MDPEGKTRLEDMDMDTLFGGCEPRPHCSLAKLQVEDDSRPLYILTKSEGDGISITVSDGGQAWGGRLIGKQMGEMALKVRMEEEQFYSETLKALTRENMGELNFVYSMRVCPSGSLELTWKKHLISDNIKFQLGVATLDPQPGERVHRQLLEFAIGSITSLQAEISSLQVERGRLVSERQAALGRLEKCISVKEDMEQDLFGKFKFVLNSKKAKIRQLMEQLSHVSEENSNRATQSVEDLDSHESEKEPAVIDLDHSKTPSPKSKGLQLPSSQVAGSSLLGEEGYEGISPVKRRRRQGLHRPAGQPKIPRPPSIPRPPTNSSKVKVHSSSGRERQKSEECMESDELLNLL